MSGRRSSLSARELRWTRALFAAMLPADMKPGLPAADAFDSEKAFDVLYRFAGGLAALGLRISLWAIWFGPVVFIRRFVTFGTLTPAERESYLVQLYDHRSYIVRQLLLGIKALACAAYLNAPETRAAFELDGPVMAELPLPDLPAPPAVAEHTS